VLVVNKRFVFGDSKFKHVTEKVWNISWWSFRWQRSCVIIGVANLCSWKSQGIYICN